MPDLYNVNDGLTGRDGGPYLDQVEARHAEDQRALVEGREPDYETMGGTVGTQYVTASQLLATESVNNLPSQFESTNAAKDKAVTALVEDSKTSLSVAFKAPDVPEDDGLDSDERTERNDKALRDANKDDNGGKTEKSDTKTGTKTDTTSHNAPALKALNEPKGK